MLTASAYQNFVQCQPSITEVSEQLSQFSVINGRPWWAVEFGRFCRGEPRNFASRLAEFVKIFCGKLWALMICDTFVAQSPHTADSLSVKPTCVVNTLTSVSGQLQRIS